MESANKGIGLMNKKHPLLSIIMAAGLFLAGLLAIPATASATTIINDPANNYFTDTTTGLDWMRLTETAGLSILEVGSQIIDPASPLAGWRYATTLEVNAVLNSILHTSGVFYNGGWDVTNGAVINDLLPLFGDLSGGSYDSFGLSLDPARPGDIIVSALLDNPFSNPGLNEDYIRLYQLITSNVNLAFYDSVPVGSFLVRNSVALAGGGGSGAPSGSVPSPATAPLLLLGLTGLAWQARRRKRLVQN